jgi:hypothetical protein
MSYFDDASLVMIPSGYKDQKVYSVKPLDGSGDLTFSRASSATRVASNGLIEKVRTNIALQSQTFDNASWTKSNSTITANATTAPDGTSTADKIVENTSNAAHYVNSTNASSGVITTVSFYAKKNERDFAMVFLTGTAGSAAWFDLTNGTVGTKQGAVLSHSITFAGSGWYRCTATYSSISSNDFAISLSTADSVFSYTGDGTSSIFIWGAQIESGDIATDYIATTSAAVSVGPVSGLPRLDYLNSTCPRLLLEPQRTNLNIFSEDFSNATWDKLNVVTTNYINQVVSPDGYTNADLAIPNTTSDSYHGFQLGSGRPSLTAGTVYTYSIFAKANGYSKIRVQNFSAGVRAQFDLSTGTLINQSGTTSTFITPYGNGWYRVGFTYTQATTVSAYWNILVVSNDDNTGSAPVAWAGNGTSSVAFWGSTIEAGAYATSYIPTLGTSVTRVADAASKTSASALIGQTEGTIFWELDIQIPTATALEASVNVDDGSGFGNTIYLYKSGAATIVAEMYVSSVAQASFSKSSITAGTYKCALAYANNNTAFFVNGVQVGSTDTSCSVPATSRIQMGQTAISNDTSLTKQLLLFKTRLTNAQLAELTTL